MAILHGNPEFEALKKAAREGKDPEAQAKLIAWMDANAKKQIAEREDRMLRKLARAAMENIS